MSCREGRNNRCCSVSQTIDASGWHRHYPHCTISLRHGFDLVCIRTSAASSGEASSSWRVPLCVYVKTIPVQNDHKSRIADFFTPRKLSDSLICQVFDCAAFREGESGQMYQQFSSGRFNFLYPGTIQQEYNVARIRKEHKWTQHSQGDTWANDDANPKKSKAIKMRYQSKAGRAPKDWLSLSDAGARAPNCQLSKNYSGGRLVLRWERDFDLINVFEIHGSLLHQ